MCPRCQWPNPKIAVTCVNPTCPQGLVRWPSWLEDVQPRILGAAFLALLPLPLGYVLAEYGLVWPMFAFGGLVSLITVGALLRSVSDRGRWLAIWTLAFAVAALAFYLRELAPRDDFAYVRLALIITIVAYGMRGVSDVAYGFSHSISVRAEAPLSRVDVGASRIVVLGALLACTAVAEAVSGDRQLTLVLSALAVLSFSFGATSILRTGLIEGLRLPLPPHRVIQAPRVMRRIPATESGGRGQRVRSSSMKVVGAVGTALVRVLRRLAIRTLRVVRAAFQFMVEVAVRLVNAVVRVILRLRVAGDSVALVTRDVAVEGSHDAWSFARDAVIPTAAALLAAWFIALASNDIADNVLHDDQSSRLAFLAHVLGVAVVGTVYVSLTSKTLLGQSADVIANLAEFAVIFALITAVEQFALAALPQSPFRIGPLVCLSGVVVAGIVAYMVVDWLRHRGDALSPQSEDTSIPITTGPAAPVTACLALATALALVTGVGSLNPLGGLRVRSAVVVGDVERLIGGAFGDDTLRTKVSGVFACSNRPIPPHALESISCSAQDSDEVLLTRFSSGSALDVAFRATMARLKPTSNTGDCLLGPAHGEWSTDRPSRTIAGSYVCWVNDLGEAEIDWTHNLANVEAVLVRKDGDLNAAAVAWSRISITP
jgi:hypothetical protein